MKNFTEIDEIFEECEAIGFRSCQVVSESGNTLVNGTATKNPWEKNQREVAAFLSKADKTYILRVRKTPRGDFEEWSYTPGKPQKVKVLEEAPANGGISLSLYTKLLSEKSAAEVRAQIAEAEVKVLKAQITELTGADPDALEEEPEEMSLADRAMNFVQSPTIAPMFANLAEMAIEGIKNLGNSKDEATAYTMQLLLKKQAGQELTAFENGLISQYFIGFGPKTQAVIGSMFQQ